MCVEGPFVISLHSATMQGFEFGMIFALSFMPFKIILHLKMNTIRIHFALWAKIMLRGSR